MLYDDSIIVVGLTGMSGAGKSTACKVFCENGFGIVDCDTVSRDVVQKDRPALKEIADYFSSDVITELGTLDRKKLGSIVFSDRQKLNKLNSIIYPYISYSVINMIYDFGKNGERFVLLDAPTLFESGVDSLCDVIVSVTAPIDTCIERIMKRDSLSYESANNRLSSQHNESFYRELSDFCIFNDGNLEKLKSMTIDIINRIGDTNG